MPASACFPFVVVARDTSSFLPIISASALRAVDAGTGHHMGGFSYVQGLGDDHNYGAWYAIILSSADQGLTPQLFWMHCAKLLACSHQELDAAVVELVATTRETEQTAPAPSRDGLLAKAWSASPTAALKVGGRVLLCIVAFLPELERLVGAPGHAS